MDNNKWGWKQGREVGRAGVVRRGGGKGRKLYLNNNLKKGKKKNETSLRSHNCKWLQRTLVINLYSIMPQ